MTKVFVDRKGPLLFFKKEGQETEPTVRYNLAEKTLEVFGARSQTWERKEQVYWFFKDCKHYNLEAEPKFKQLIALCAKAYPNCKSLSTFFARLEDVLIYEVFMHEEIKFEEPSTDYRGEAIVLKLPLSKYPGHFKKLIKVCEFEVNRYTEELLQKILGTYSSYRDTITAAQLDALSKYLLENDFTKEERKDVIMHLMNDYTMEKFAKLVNIHKYDSEALIKFCVKYLKPFENLSIGASLTELYDYYSMASQIGRNVKKYPKYLRSMHDIILANFEAYKKEYNKQRFEEAISKIGVLEHEKGKYCILAPKQPQDIISEGTNLNHCVGSYVNRIIEGETVIVFLRHIEAKESSLITVEVYNNTIVQAKGSYNRALAEEEMNWLEDWAKTKKLELKI